MSAATDLDGRKIAVIAGSAIAAGAAAYGVYYLLTNRRSGAIVPVRSKTSLEKSTFPTPLPTPHPLSPTSSLTPP